MPKSFRIAYLFLLPAVLAAPTSAAEPESPWRKTLADGSVVELVGVSTNPSGPKTWWSPDGKLLDKAPYDEPIEYHLDYDRLKEGAFAREFAVRLTTADEDATVDVSVSSGRASVGVGARSKQDGRLTTFVRPHLAVFSTDETTCKVRCWGGVGPWRTEAEIPPRSMGSRGYGRGQELLFAGTWELANGNVLEVVTAVLKDDVQSQVVAIDRSGALRPCSTGTGSGSNDFYQHANEYKLKLADIREFRFQTRPTYRAEFPNVPLHPKTQGPAK